MSNLIVYKSNKVVEAAYKLSLNEQKVILTCIAKHDTRQPLAADNLFEVTAKEFAELTGVDIDRAYAALKEVADNLFRRYVIIGNPDVANLKIKKRKMHWLSSINYMQDGGGVSLRFAYDILPYLSELKDKFTKYELKHVGGMTSKYGIRLYELLTQYRTLGRREIAIDWLRSHFELGDNYSAIGDLKKRVIKAACDDINEHSDLKVRDPIYQKTGRVVTHVTFDFNTNPKKSGEKLAPKNSVAKSDAAIDPLEEYAATRKRFGDKLPMDAIPAEVIEQLKAQGRW